MRIGQIFRVRFQGWNRLSVQRYAQVSKAHKNIKLAFAINGDRFAIAEIQLTDGYTILHAYDRLANLEQINKNRGVVLREGNKVPFSHFFPHRAFAAFAAIWERLRGPRAAARAVPPLRPPRRPRATACGFLDGSIGSGWL